MSMHSKAKPATKYEQARFKAIYSVGCTPCWLKGISFEPCTIQHVVEGRKRLGHAFTYGACPWHHFGHPKEGKTKDEMTYMLGPSLAHGKKPYEKEFGPERELVVLTNELIKSYMDHWYGGEYS